MDADLRQVVTIIHNNLESQTMATGFEEPMAYQRNVTYFATKQQIAAVKVNNYSHTQAE